MGSNLSDGFETFRQLDDTVDDHLDSLLRTLIALEEDNGQKCEADFITWRGMMTKASNDRKKLWGTVHTDMYQIMVSVYDNLGGGRYVLLSTERKNISNLLGTASK